MLNRVATIKGPSDTVFVDETYHPAVTAEFITDRIVLESTVNQMVADGKRGKLYGEDRENDRLIIMDVEQKRVTGTSGYPFRIDSAYTRKSGPVSSVSRLPLISVARSPSVRGKT